jgi:hypothetical protein
VKLRSRKYPEIKSSWNWALAAICLIPIPFIALYRKSLFTGTAHLTDAQWSLTLGWSGNALMYFMLVCAVFIVFNMERTIRSSIGRTRWQLKFMALGVGGLFALRIYVVSQSILFSTFNVGFGTTLAMALLAANLLFAFSLARGRSLNVDVYFSRATIQNSLTIILAGIYLLAVGLLRASDEHLSARRMRSRWTHSSYLFP